MKILFVNVFYKPFIGGGAEITLENLIKGMKLLGHNVSVLTLTNEKNIVYEKVEDVDVIRLPIKNLYFPNFKIIKKPSYNLMKLWILLDVYNPLNNKNIKKIVKDINPDIVSLHNLQGFSIAIWSVLKQIKYPFVQVLHDQYFLCPANFVRHGKMCKTQCFHCKILRMPHKIKSDDINVVGISKFVLNKFLSYGYFKNSRLKKVIYNSRNFGDEIYLNNRIKSDKKIIYGFMGTLIKYKGIEKLLYLFKTVPELQQHILLVAGSGEKQYEEYLKKKYESSNIKFLGRISPRNFYPNIDVTVVPSIVEEALGMVAIESLMYGKPVIVSNRGALPEIVDNKLLGKIFNISDNNDLLKKLLEFKKEIEFYKLNERNIRNMSIEKFGYDNWIKTWDETYKFLIKNK
jgi:glycosyltransferase involved in cell wall biosynthesis